MKETMLAALTLGSKEKNSATVREAMLVALTLEG